MIAFDSGPSPRFRSRGDKNQKGCHIFKMQYWMYVATGAKREMGGTDFKWGGLALLPPPQATALL